MSLDPSSRAQSSPGGAAIRTAVLSAALLAACGGGGGGIPPPKVTGNGFAPATGPGDASAYFPHAVGDRWILDDLASGTGRSEVAGTLTATVSAPRTVLGVTATVVSQVYTGGTLGGGDEFFAVGPGGVTFLGSDPADAITPRLAPYPRLLFPVGLGSVAVIDAKNLPIGTDPLGNPVLLDLTQRIVNEAFEPVSVAAGTFGNALRQVTTIDGSARGSAISSAIPFTGRETRWLVPGVGLVKQSTTTTVGEEVSSSLAELRGYTVGGVPHGVGSPVALPGGLAPEGAGVHCFPATASDGAGFLTVARKVVAGAGGGLLSSWVAQPIGPDGAPLGDGLEIDPPRAVATISNPRRAAVASDGSGYLAVLESADALSFWELAASLVAVLVSPQGVPLAPPVTVADTDLASPAVSAPVLAFDGSRYLLVFLRRDDNTLYQVKGLFISPTTGQADGAEFAIVSEPGYYSAPALSFDGSNFLVVWNQEPWLTQPRGIFARRVDPAGQLLGTGSFAVVLPSGGAGSAAVAFDGANHLVLWTDMTDLHARRVSPAGALLDGDASSAGIAVTAAPGPARVLPKLTFFDGEYLAAWMVSPSPGMYLGLDGARLSPAGLVLSPGSGGIRLVPEGFLTGPSLAAGLGSALLTWLDAYAPGGASAGAVGLFPFGR